MGTYEDVRHGSPPHAGEGVIGSATPLAWRGPHLRLGSVPPGSCAHERGQDSVPRKPCKAPKGSRQQGSPRRWRRCWAIDGDGALQTPPTTLHACAPRTSLRATGHALRVSSGAFPAPGLVRVMRRGAVADRCDV